MVERATDWSRIRERGSMWGLRFTVACYRLLGPLLSLPLIHAVVAYFFLTDFKGRAASRCYLERIHTRSMKVNGDAPSWKPGTWESFLHYREFALSIADRVALWGGRESRFRFEFHGREHFDKLSEQKRGAILLGAHLGSFDALRVLSVQDRVTVNVLMYTRHAPKINEIMRKLSPAADVRVIHADPDPTRTAFDIRARVARGEWVAILADRVEPGDRGRTCSVEFLGAPATLPEAPFLLPVILGVPAILILALRSRRRRYDVYAEPLAEGGERVPVAKRAARARDIACAYSRRLEHYCGLAHRQWFNFFDFWKDGEAV
jgi:predicted LPLAT superfamily acyltransferase